MACQTCDARTLAAGTLPHSLLTIQDGAFADCVTLTAEPALLATVKTVGRNAFDHTGLTAVRLPAACQCNAAQKETPPGKDHPPLGCVVIHFEGSSLTAPSWALESIVCDAVAQ